MPSQLTLFGLGDDGGPSSPKPSVHRETIRVSLWNWDAAIIPLDALSAWLDEQLGMPESWLGKPLLTVVNLWYELYDQVTAPYDIALESLKNKPGLSESAHQQLRRAINTRQNQATGLLYAAYGDRQLFLVDQILIPLLAKLENDDAEWIGERLNHYMQCPDSVTSTRTMGQLCEMILDEWQKENVGTN